jgi:hypothetical protein
MLPKKLEEAPLEQPKSLGDDSDRSSIPAFMQIEGRVAAPLHSQTTAVRMSKRSPESWAVVAILIAIMVALMIPGLLVDWGRGF